MPAFSECVREGRLKNNAIEVGIGSWAGSNSIAVGSGAFADVPGGLWI